MIEISSTQPAGRRAPVVARTIDLPGLAAAMFVIASSLGMLAAIWRVSSTLDPLTLTKFIPG